MPYFYPRSPCGERRVTVLGIQHRVGISIHALLAESDGGGLLNFFDRTIFLSTLSLRRATSERVPLAESTAISIHALLAESDPSSTRKLTNFIISIHALLAESDLLVFTARYPAIRVFLSTLSLRRATAVHIGSNVGQYDFYPRSPCGERPSRLHKNICVWGFLSTLSLRRATPLYTIAIARP